MALDSLNAPQPAPTAGQGEELWPLIYGNEALALPEWLVADMAERHRAGVAKYGVPLRVWNGRDAVVDAYQEALDLVVYVQQARCRLGVYSLRQRSPGDASKLNARLALDLAFHTAMQTARHLGELARLNVVPSQPPKEVR
jgi:hypothetical protein